MLLKTCDDFLANYPRYKKFTKGTPLEDVFNNILASEDSIIRMLNLIEHDITPIAACAIDIETYLSNNPSPDVTLDRNIDEGLADNCRQCLGAMVATLVSPFGMEKIQGRNRPIPAKYKGIYLSSGATYSQTGTATHKLVQVITRIND